MMTETKLKSEIAAMHGACLRYSNGGNTPKFIVYGIVDAMTSIDERARDLYKTAAFRDGKFEPSLARVTDRVIHDYYFA